VPMPRDKANRRATFVETVLLEAGKLKNSREG
jgi:hypothetical protein